MVNWKISVLKLLITILFIQGSAMACEWPSNLYRIKSKYELSLSPFFAWISTSESLATIIREQNFIEYQFDKVRIRFIGHNNMFLVLLNDVLIDTISLDYSSGKELLAKDLISFNWPLPKNGEQLIIRHSQSTTSLTLDFSDKDVNKMIADKPQESLQTRLLEYSDDDKNLKSKFWYKCKTCDGDPLIMIRTEPSCNTRYFARSVMSELAPNHFSMLAGFWRGGMVRFFSDIVHSWPEPETEESHH